MTGLRLDFFVRKRLASLDPVKVKFEEEAGEAMSSVSYVLLRFV